MPVTEDQHSLLASSNPDLFFIIPSEFRASTENRAALARHNCIGSDEGCKDAGEECDTADFET
ncbi:MAG: hypothetical protein H6Q30_702 [Bacteroidetes bacterium]|nr:hypothetical protein [Bacteroidota bacterium]